MLFPLVAGAHRRAGQILVASGTDTSSVVPIRSSAKRSTAIRHLRTQMKDQELEEPVPDSVEQQLEAVPAADEAEEDQSAGLPLEADEADVAEQAKGLGLED